MEDEFFNNTIRDFETKVTLIKENYDASRKLLDALISHIREEKEKNQSVLSKFQKYPSVQSDIVEFNVGGQNFSTLKSTVTKKIKKQGNDKEEFYQPNMLEGLVEGYVEPVYDKDKRIFIDRSPKLFGMILDYLRMANTDDRFNLPADVEQCKEIRNEASFYNIEGIFDMIVSKSLDSRILSAEQTNALIELGDFSLNDEWKLLYSGRDDGFSAGSFHAKCDNIANTLVIIKASTGNIFGGFTRAKWDQLNQYKIDKDAFIFSLVRKGKDDDEEKRNKPMRFNVTVGRENYAIFCTGHYGPTFGGGHDLFLSTNCNAEDSTSNANLGNCFRHPDFRVDEESKNFLAGTSVFRVEEIEVFAKKLPPLSQ